jgi:acetyl esterase/lipase
MKSLIALALALLTLASPAAAEDYAYETYAEMRADFGVLYQEEKFEEGARLLQWARGQFPDHLMANSFNLALCLLQMDRIEDAAAALSGAHEGGSFFSSWALANEVWDPLREKGLMEALESRNEELRAAAQAEARPELKVVLPEGHDPDRPYPLFIALHGGGGNMEDFSRAWTSPGLASDWIVAYPQSSRVVGMKAFSWTEDMRLSLREVDEAYQKMLGDYRIDPRRVIVGGFSSGGVTAIELAAANTLPMAGFVSLCPPAAEGLDEARAAAMAERGLRGVLLSTEMDGRLDQQKAMVETLDAAGMPIELVVTPDVGHWFPEDLDTQIDSAIAFVLEK